MLRKVVLHGSAREAFTGEIELDVASLAEVARALQVFYPGFREYLVEHNFQVVHKSPVMDWELGENDVSFHLGKGDIHIMPVIEGAGGENNGLMKLIAGVLIAAVAWWAAPAAGGLGASLLGGGGIFGGLTYGNVVMLGLGLAASGLSSMLTPKQNTDAPKDSSFMLNGQLNQTEQGGPVPLIYGRTDVSSVLISAGMSSVDIPIGSSARGGIFGGSGK